MTQVRHSTEILWRFRARRVFWAAFGIAAISNAAAFAQSSPGPAPSNVASAANVSNASDGGASSENGGGTLFVPSVDLDSPSVFSSVDAARRNRPPKPTKVKEDLFYPEDFLTLSEETPEKSSESPSDAAKSPSVPSRRLNPNVETTPIGPPSEPEPPKKSRGDQMLFFSISIALAALGVFVYFDYRYRDRLRVDLAKNARLCSPGAVAADFAEALANDAGALVEPTSFVDPNLDAPPFLFAGTSSVDDPLKNDVFGRFAAVDGASDADDGAGYNAVGADLKEENFDFAPTVSTSNVEEPREDFVVGQSDATK